MQVLIKVTLTKINKIQSRDFLTLNQVIKMFVRVATIKHPFHLTFLATQVFTGLIQSNYQGFQKNAIKQSRY